MDQVNVGVNWISGSKFEWMELQFLPPIYNTRLNDPG